MENNFNQMAASDGHAVAYIIGPIFHQWLHEHSPLKRQLSLAYWRNAYV